jgi:hypothetical protein
MSHPDPASLALFAGNDLPVWSRWSVGAHVRRCAECRSEVEGFRTQAEWVREAASELPAELHWATFSAEMKANIQVGLAAGECVGTVQMPPSSLGFRAAASAALACIALVAISGWFLHFPRPSPRTEGIVLSANRGGIELKQEDGILTLKHSGTERVMVSASAQGSLAARFVDDETGMVTINNVYLQ